MSSDPDAELLRALFDAAVAAADPGRILPPWLPPRPRGRIIVVGAGKAGAAMARAVEQHYGPDLEGVVVVPYGHAVGCASIEIVEAAHPVPDDSGVTASARIVDLAAGAGPDDLVIALVSGGASALLAAPPAGLSLAAKQSMTRALLLSGAPITEINLVRRHLSRVKGGQLAAAAWPARVLGLAISDVPGDDPSVIGSGPTVGSRGRPDEVLQILRRRGIETTPALLDVLASTDGPVAPDDERLGTAETIVVATPQSALEAAARVAEAHGLRPVILGSALEGEARAIGTTMAGIALQVRRHAQPVPPPCVLLSGGETTVTVSAGTPGVGGRNAEFLLAAAIGLGGAEGITALAADTDGIDGAAPVAGAIIDASTLTRAARLGLDPRGALDRHDAHTFFGALGAQVVTGPTRTNVNDFRAFLVR